jgi:hypothetical protein
MRQVKRRSSVPNSAATSASQPGGLVDYAPHYERIGKQDQHVARRQRGGAEQRLERRSKDEHSGYRQFCGDRQQQVAIAEHADRSQRPALRPHRERAPDLAEDHAQERHRGGLQVGVVEAAARASRIARMPSRADQDVEEPADGQAGDHQAEEQPGADQHGRTDHAFGPPARRAVHDSRLGWVAA